MASIPFPVAIPPAIGGIVNCSLPWELSGVVVSSLPLCPPASKPSQLLHQRRHALFSAKTLLLTT
jgi:hypothetical protein